MHQVPVYDDPIIEKNEKETAKVNGSKNKLPQKTRHLKHISTSDGSAKGTNSFVLFLLYLIANIHNRSLGPILGEIPLTINRFTNKIIYDFEWTTYQGKANEMLLIWVPTKVNLVPTSSTIASMICEKYPGSWVK